jgi:hypothetical protein
MSFLTLYKPPGTLFFPWRGLLPAKVHDASWEIPDVFGTIRLSGGVFSSYA